ncbi:MAG: hypothetical protein ACR2I2_00205 [Bryobacteraceae bacterium]
MATKVTRFLIGGGLAVAGLLAGGRFDMKVRNDFFAGFAGDNEALQRGMKASEEALAANPKHAEALVWHGAGLFFEAGQFLQKHDMEKGQEYWTRGLKEMDDAGAMEPDSVSVLAPRGSTVLTASRFVPAEMAKPLIERGVADFQHILDMQTAYFDTLGTHPRGELLIFLADGYSRLGQEEKARTLFTRAQTDLAGTVYAKKAAVWLETKSLPASQAACSGCHTPASANKPALVQ